MDKANRKWAEQKRILPAWLLLCIGGILLNIAGAQAVIVLKLPIYLDSIGTVLAAIIGGLIPGVIVGFCTNIINGFGDSVTIYYVSISVLLAIVAARFARKGYFSKFPHILLVILTLALIGGGIGSVLTWFLYGGQIGEGISSGLSYTLFGSGRFSLFFAQLVADFLIDLADKTITVLLVALILRVLPVRAREVFPALKIDPAGRDEAVGEHRATRGLNLEKKLLLIISILAIIVTTAVSTICVSLYRDAVIKTESKMAFGVARSASEVFDAERVDEYMERGEEAPGYRESELRLSVLQRSSEDIEYVYVYKILKDGCHVVFDPDTEDTPGGDPGEVLPFDRSFEPYIPALLAGEEIEPVVSNDTFGWFLTVYLPVRDADGICRCYVGVDISMKQLSANQRVFMAKVISLFVGFFVLVLAIGSWLASIGITKPVNALAKTTGHFVSNSESGRKESLAAIDSLDIRTGDEIENLYHSVQTMTGEVVRYLEDIQKKNEQINKIQNGLILVLADLVESRDKCTGNHVRNTAIYTRMILEKMKELGMYPDQLTEEFIEDVVNGAPLHDIGKIQIPDYLLNKPGRLTNEEFIQMQDHTVKGGEVIYRVNSMFDVQGGSYLQEAYNLTLHHHERWDGKGYPDGLKGEEIPLSARVMAVADVFDALVARRSYKDGFPFEKAISIIREESGTHFDKNVVDAFLLCQDEARKVAEEANMKSAQEY